MRGRVNPCFLSRSYRLVAPKAFDGWIPYHWSEPMNDIHSPANFFTARERRADADKTADGREHRQHDQRHPHRFRRFMRRVRMMLSRAMLFLLRVAFMLQAVLVTFESLCAPESHGHQARHVKRSAGRRNRAH